MKKTVAFLLMSAFLFMGSMCGVEISSAAVNAFIQKQCGIVVPYLDIAALVAANPLLTTVDEVGNAICNAFKAQQAKTPTAAPLGHVIVDGVLVHYTVK